MQKSSEPHNMLHAYFRTIIMAMFISLIPTAVLVAESEHVTPDQALIQRHIPIGVQGFPNKGSAESWVQAEELLLSFTKELFPWTEDKAGRYRWAKKPERDPLKKYFVKLKSHGHRVQVVDSTVHMDQKHLPKYLKGRRFNDPELLDRWEAYLTALLDRYGDQIDFFAIGNEVASYFGDKPGEWKDYIEFFARGSETIHRLRPDIPVGIVLTGGDMAHYWEDVEQHCDYLGFNYYTPCSAFGKNPTANALDPEHPKYFAKSLEKPIRVAAGKKVLISEIGCATHPSIDSSPELQAQFIRELFAWLCGKEDKILALCWLSSADWPYKGTRQALKGWLDSALLEHEPFVRYLTSLGLMYEDGTKKPGYGVFKEEMLRYRSEERRL